MKTYQAGKDPVETWGGETRAWVFDLLENPDYRRRLEALSELDLKRRAGCEPCLRALVTDDWDYESLHHLGWCESCRAASLALGMDTSSKKAGGYPYKRALVVAMVAAVAIAAPLAGNRLLDGRGGGNGGVAQQGPQTTPGTNPSTTPGRRTTLGDDADDHARDDSDDDPGDDAHDDADDDDVDHAHHDSARQAADQARPAHAARIGRAASRRCPKTT